MADKDTALAIVQAALAIAGLVLVYSGFLAAKGADADGARRGDKLYILARLALVPELFAFFCAGMGVRALRAGHWGADWSASWLILSFEILLATTSLYAMIAAWLSTS